MADRNIARNAKKKECEIVTYEAVRHKVANILNGLAMAQKIHYKDKNFDNFILWRK